MASIGVLALQGDFAEHERVIASLGASVREVRLPRDLNGLDGLILPGGETTTFRRLLDLYDLIQPLRAFAMSGKPLWGTCAGLIVMAREIEGHDPVLGLMDVAVRRNAYGRQVDSFEADIAIPALGEAPYHAVFIRAPVILSVGPKARILASLEDGSPVAVAQDNLLGTTFHPELTPDPRFHAYFLKIVSEATQPAHAAAR